MARAIEAELATLEMLVSEAMDSLEHANWLHATLATEDHEDWQRIAISLTRAADRLRVVKLTMALHNRKSDCDQLEDKLREACQILNEEPPLETAGG